MVGRHESVTDRHEEVLGRAGELLCEAARWIDPPYRLLAQRLPEPLCLTVGYHRGWWEIDGSPRAAGSGKSIRPAFVLASATAAGGASSDAALHAALAVELAHDWSLVHDDVMDRDRERRQRPAVWVTHGVGRAVLLGDMLLVLAQSQAASLASASGQALTRALAQMCIGQWADLDLTGQTAVAIADVVGVSEGKTGALLGAACEMGALAGGADPPAAAAYRGFGIHLGVAFQAVDDLLGIWGDPAITGKPVGADLAIGKRSIPVVAALANRGAASAELASLLAGESPLDEAGIARATELVDAAGGRRAAESLASDRAERAFSELSVAAPDTAALNDLNALAAIVLERTR